VVALLHQYDAVPTLNGEPGTTVVPAAAGDIFRVRLVNTDNALTALWVTGAPYVVAAVDGTDLNRPTPVIEQSVGVTAGGRVDLRITVPDGGVRIDFGGTTALVLGADPTGGAVPPQPREFVDLLSYGEPMPSQFQASHADRVFEYRIGRRLGFLDGVPGRWWTINGHLFPDVPMYVVEQGDLVVMRIENNSGESHPMHLHGHHALVVSRDGVRSTGSPWWVDSLEVGTGETWEIAFEADNPGIWMDHCHNLPHAADGLVAHLMYAGVSSSFRVGDAGGNQPE
jgi:FtsP/CotA-like multicopper oxidase with cupredoxin domain